MSKCPLCDLAVDDTDLSRHYLKDLRLAEFIQQTHKNWTPSDGACSHCLESFFRAMGTPTNLRDEITDERTVITAAEEFIRDAADEEGASLITIHGLDLGKKYDLPDGDLIVGRGESSHVRVNEENVSRTMRRSSSRGRK